MSRLGKCRGLLVVGLTAALASCVSGPQSHSDGNATIRASAGRSEIVITTTARLSGAIHSLRWDGKEFINSVDHGRQLQSASNFDAGVHPIRAETFNPTEAGSRRDHVGPRSTSRLEWLRTRGNALESSALMAFWLAPGETSGGHPARNTTLLSDHRLEKRVVIGWREFPHVIDYEVAFTVPATERHTHAVFEALTGYMPAEFSRFWKFEPIRGELAPLSDGPGEQEHPVILATESGSHAMGIWSPEPDARYGRFRFARERVVKWNCVFRRGRPGEPVLAGRYSFRQFVIVGDLATVRETMRRLPEAYAVSR